MAGSGGRRSETCSVVWSRNAAGSKIVDIENPLREGGGDEAAPPFGTKPPAGRCSLLGPLHCELDLKVLAYLHLLGRCHCIRDGADTPKFLRRSFHPCFELG